MTIRDHLRKRFWAVFGVTLFLLMLLLAVLVASVEFRLISPYWILLFFALLAGGMAAVLQTFRCLRCNATLSSLIGYFGPFSTFATKIAYCPFCGVNLDEAQQGVPADRPRIRSAGG